MPVNLYIIGTMNTFDDNLALSDYALRRRFCFYDIAPVFENESFKEFCKYSPLLEKVIGKIKEINLELDENMQIGHSYFCKPMPDSEIRMVVKYSILPLLKEYFKKTPSKYEKLSKELWQLVSE